MLSVKMMDEGKITQANSKVMGMFPILKRVMSTQLFNKFKSLFIFYASLKIFTLYLLDN